MGRQATLERDMSVVHAGAERWRQEEALRKRHQLREDLDRARRRADELQRDYNKDFLRASRMPDRRGAAAIAAAFDQADQTMAELLAARKSIEQLERKLHAP